MAEWGQGVRYELFRPIDTPIVSGAHPLPASTTLVVDGYAVAFISTDLSAAVVYDLEGTSALAARLSALFSDLAVSDDGSHLAQVGADGLEVWDLRTGRRLFQEARRVRPGRPNQLLGTAGTRSFLSPDGRRIAGAAPTRSSCASSRRAGADALPRRCTARDEPHHGPR